MQTIYKICPASAWREAEATGLYRGSADDLRDGFIHFSTAEQLAGTLAKHFHGQHDLVLIAVESDKLGAALRFEPSRGGALFPHLYGEMAAGAATSVTAIALRADGSHAIPDLAA